ncbi:hypothetical protein JMG10_32960 [Nostoc ellipsosporum NOK]|nr:hypothetical protein [Nostoc ellipsosporum NOK]
MSNVLTMTAEAFESRKNTQAALMTLGIAGLLLLIMILWKHPIVVMQPPPMEEGITVDLQLPPEVDPPLPPGPASGGGGGGNPVEAPGKAGTAPYTPPQPGEDELSKDVDEFPPEKTSPPVIKPEVPRPEAKEVNKNTSPHKDPAQPVTTAPQPVRKPTYTGATTNGSGTGGNEAAVYTRPGGSGTGSGVGNGSGQGGGRGTGAGGGNGSGGGRGAGPRMISGNRTVIGGGSKMDAGENLRGKTLAKIKVSPDGIGTYMGAERGSTLSSGQAIDIIREWLRRNRFNKSESESVVVYEFNFLLGG